jgi:hypothetical protein
LRVAGVDGRFHKKILASTKKEKQSAKRAPPLASHLARCTPAGCLPDFITIGAQKGGTTSLYYYLQQYHGGIETSKKEELNFFSERSVCEWLLMLRDHQAVVCSVGVEFYVY